MYTDTDQLSIPELTDSEINSLTTHILQQVMESTVEAANSDGDLKQKSIEEVVDDLINRFDKFASAFTEKEVDNLPEEAANNIKKAQALKNNKDKLNALVRLRALQFNEFDLQKAPEDQDTKRLQNPYFNDDHAFKVNDFTKTSTRIKLAFAFLDDVYVEIDENNNIDYKVKLGFIKGTYQKVDYRRAYYTVKHILSDIGVDANFDVMVEELQKYKYTYPFINHLLSEKNPNSLVNMTGREKSEFVSNMTTHHVKMYMHQFSKVGKNNNKYKFRNIDVHSDDNKERIIKTWREAFANHDYSERKENNEFVIRPDKVIDGKSAKQHFNQAWEEFERIIDNNDDISPKRLKEWLERYNISMPVEVFENISVNPLQVNKGELDNLNALINSKAGLGAFRIFFRNLRGALNNGKTVEYNENKIFKDSAVIRLAELSSIYMSNPGKGPKRVYDQQMNRYGLPRYMYSRLAQLKKNPDEVNRILNTPYGKDALYEQEIRDENNVKQPLITQLETYMVSLVDQQERFKRPDINAGIENRNYIEHEVLKTHAMLLNRYRPKFSLPTMGDKKNKFMAEGKPEHFVHASLDVGGKHIALGKDTVKTVFKQVVLPELRRIASNQGQNNDQYEEFNEKNKLLLSFPDLMDVEYGEGDSKKVFFTEDGRYNDMKWNSKKQEVEFLDSTLREELISNLDTILNQRIHEKVNKWNNSNIFQYLDNKLFVDYELRAKSKVKESNITIDKWATTKIAADVYIGNLIFFSEYDKFVSQSPVQYATIIRYNNTGEVDWGKSLQFSIKNRIKRFSGIHSPVERGDTSILDAFNQIVAKDVTLYTSKVPEYLSKFGDNYKNIQSTDGQELYTPYHMASILRAHGRITEKDYKGIIQALNLEKQALKENKNPFPLDRKYKILLQQPLKPHYFGLNSDNKLAYIKSSAITMFYDEMPKPLRDLYKDMVRTGKSTTHDREIHRITFESASKLNHKKATHIFNEDGTFRSIKDSYVHRLSYRWGGIHSVSPSKSREVINIKSQHRTLLHAGLNNSYKIFDSLSGNEVGGANHKKLFFQKYRDLYASLYTELLLEFGAEIKISGEIKKSSIDKSKLAKYLYKEAEKRGYSLRSISQLKYEANNFKVPLGLNQSSDGVQSLLLSIINDRILRYEIPGKKYVLQSAIGFDTICQEQSNIPLLSGIVPVKNWRPEHGLKGMRPSKNGNSTLPAQVIIPFQFRDKKGNLLKLAEFTTTDKNGRKIFDSDKIDEELLKFFGFRIPTQSQSSMSTLEVVAFLPETAGDKIIAPSQLIKQMSYGFDFNMLYTHRYHHQIKNDGIRRLDYKDIDVLSKYFDNDNVNKLKKYHDNTGNDYSFRDFCLNIKRKRSKQLIDELLKMKMDVGSSNDAIELFHKPISNNNFKKNIEELGESLQGIFIKNNNSRKNYRLYDEQFQTCKYIKARSGKKSGALFSILSVFMGNSEYQDIKLLNPSWILRNMRLANTTPTNQINVDKKNKSITYKLCFPTESRSGRRIIDVIESYQSAALNNIKQNILDDLYIDKDKCYAILGGIFLGYEEPELSLFHHHPAIEEVIYEWRNINNLYSNEFTTLGELIDEKIEELGGVSDNDISNAETQQERKQLVNVRMKKLSYAADFTSLNELAIRAFGQWDENSLNKNQKMHAIYALSVFKELYDLGKKIILLASIFDKDSKGVGKNFAEVFSDSNALEEQTNFVGVNDLIENTLKGQSLNVSSKAVEGLFKEHYPFKKMKRIGDELIKMLDIDSHHKKTEVYRTVFREFPEFINAGTINSSATIYKSVEYARHSLGKNLYNDNRNRLNATIADVIKKAKSHSATKNNFLIEVLDPKFNDYLKLDEIHFSLEFEQSNNIKYQIAGESLYNDDETVIGKAQMHINGTIDEIILTPKKVMEFLVIYQQCISKEISAYSLSNCISQYIVDDMGITEKQRELYDKFLKSVDNETDFYIRFIMQFVQANTKFVAYESSVKNRANKIGLSSATPFLRKIENGSTHLYYHVENNRYKKIDTIKDSYTIQYDPSKKFAINVG